jgi:hypothetical protein
LISAPRASLAQFWPLLRKPPTLSGTSPDEEDQMGQGLILELCLIWCPLLRTSARKADCPLSAEVDVGRLRAPERSLKDCQCGRSTMDDR